MLKISKNYFITEQKSPLIPKKWADLRWVKFLCGIASALIAIICPVYCFLMIEYLHFGSEDRLLKFLSRDMIPYFGLLVCVFIYLLLLLISKKLWLSNLFAVILSVTLGLVNRFKFSSTGDYFYPWDIQQAKNLGELTKFTAVSLTLAAIIVIIGGICLVAVSFVLKTELPFTFPVRIVAFLLISVCLFISVSTPKKAEKMINSFGIYFEDTALQTSNYEANGFTGAFTVNLLSANVSVPNGYNKDAISEIFANFDDNEADENFASPDIILILSESYWDPRLIKGAEFSSNPFENFDDITQKEGVISGRLFQTGFGGGTVRPEFEILTGLTTDSLPAGSVPWRYIEEETQSYITTLRDIGYETYAVHPYYSRFYDRTRAYPLIGIDNLYFAEELEKIEAVDAEYKSVRSYVSDDSFEKYIEYFLENDRTDSPRFIFGISMENHQAYLNKYEDITMEVSCDGLSEESINILANFAQGVRNADIALGKLVDYIEQRDRPTVLVYFGDHLPSLGANYAAYLESGTIGNIYNRTKEEYEFMQSTPFLVYSNYGFTGTSEDLHTGSDNNITSYNLLNSVFDLIGAPKTKLGEFLTDYAETIPYYNSRLGIELSEDEKYFVLAHRMITYDRINTGEKYSLK